MGERARQARELIGAGQAVLAERLGINRSSLQRFETGKRSLHVTTLVALCRELGQPTGWLIGNEGPGPVVVSRPEWAESDRRRRKPDGS